MFPIKLFHLELFVSEIEKQSNFAINSFNTIKSCIEAQDIDGTWFFVQSFLIATSNVSKLLWNSNELIKGRSKLLRDTLSVDNNSLLKNRNMRNNFEHYDERLEQWVTKVGTNYISDNIGSLDQISIHDITAENYLRQIDPTTLKFLFRGVAYDLPVIVIEINKLLLQIKNFNRDKDPLLRW